MLGPMPTVSVVMVFHRVTPFLRSAITSVRAQTLRDWELVLVDNGTGVAPGELGDAGRDPRLVWVRLPGNAGIPAGHNAGVAASRGEFLSLLDYDDLALPRRLERQVERLRAEPDLGLVSSLAETIGPDDQVTGREFSLLTREGQKAYTQFAAPVVTPAYTGRREVFAALPYREEFPLSADFDFLARAAERWPMAAVSEVLLRYRWHIAQATQRHRLDIEQSRCLIRLLTARRRAGRPENLAELLRETGPAPSPAESCRRMSRRCLAEGFGVLAAYHARRSLSLERTPAAFGSALWLAWRATFRCEGAARIQAARHFVMGPVRALRLQPA